MASNKVIYRVARTRDELEGVYALVYKEYLRRGYIPKGYSNNLRLSLYNALPDTTTFIAKQQRTLAATVTLVPDSKLGILMDKLYKNEVDVLRSQGRRVAEVSQLAINSAFFPQGLFSMFNFNKLIFLFKLFRQVLDYAFFVEKLTDLCIAFNPRHQHLYRFLQFEQIGGLKYYGAFHSPAIAMHLDLTRVQEKAKKRKGLYKIFFSGKPDLSAFKGKYHITPEDLEYFFIKKSDIFKKASKVELGALKCYYPPDAFSALIKKISARP
ncbi:MAG: hypothetical protein ABH865_09275 [Candidatus Omnitrophota bacterium]|nr:hypothetical protein [Candidatus Omnitrophota bacterium]